MNTSLACLCLELYNKNWKLICFLFFFILFSNFEKNYLNFRFWNLEWMFLRTVLNPRRMNRVMIYPSFKLFLNHSLLIVNYNRNFKDTSPKKVWMLKIWIILFLANYTFKILKFFIVDDRHFIFKLSNWLKYL